MSWMSAEWEDHMAPPASLSDAHSHWHAVNGPYGCPLDCAMSDPYYYLPDGWEDPDNFLSQSEIEERNAAYAGVESWVTSPF